MSPDAPFQTDSMSDRIFTQAEVSELLSKAARLEGAIGTHKSGLTLAEVKDAARAAGIDPSWVDTALKTTAKTPEAKTYAGITTSVHRERVLPNPIDENQWGRIVAELRRSLGGRGTAESIGGNRAWERAPLRVVIENVDGRAIVTAEAEWAADVKGAVWSTALTAVMALAFGIPAAVTMLPPLIFFTALILSAGVFGGVSIWRYKDKAARVGDKFDGALDQIERLAKPDRSTAAHRTAAKESPEVSAPKQVPSAERKELLDGAVGYWQGESPPSDRSRQRDQEG